MDTNLRDSGKPSKEFLAMVKRAKASAQKKLAQSKKAINDDNFDLTEGNMESPPQEDVIIETTRYGRDKEFEDAIALARAKVNAKREKAKKTLHDENHSLTDGNVESPPQVEAPKQPPSSH